MAPSKNDHEHSHDSRFMVFGERTELVFSLISGACLTIGFLLAITSSAPAQVSLALYLFAYFFGAFFAILEVRQSISHGKFKIDFLMLVAAAGAGFLGEWAEGALLLFLFSLGHALESFAMGKARAAIAALAALAPKTALVKRNGETVKLPIDELVPGDTVIVKPNARIPADGIVAAGNSSVDQSSITGESMPVDKTPAEDPNAAWRSAAKPKAENVVFAGTINGAGAMEILATRAAEDSTLAKVVKMVAEAEEQRSPTQRFTDKFEKIFVPSVLVLVVLALLAGVVIDEPFSTTFYRAMAVMVAASPCALAIATPSAVLSGVARAARNGVLVKGGGPLEMLGALEAIAFDKTGTLTEGRPQLTNVVPAEGVFENELLNVAVAVERLSDHPLARAVVEGGEARNAGGALTAKNLRALIGRGVTAEISEQSVYIGKDDLFTEIGGPALPPSLRTRVDELEAGGRTTMIVRLGERYLGVLGVMDAPREDAARVVSELRNLGIEHMIMLSGDNQRVASSVAAGLGLDGAWGDLMPQDKVDAIIRLRAEQGEVAMIGDGVNDAPALANASVGIAMGAAGSDVALETADVALMADDLSRLPFAVGLSRAARRMIRQNLWFSLGVVAFLIPATLFGLGIGPAVIIHEGSTLVVVANALRLLAYKDSR
ncbi:Lead, cadmium, zinc and mercury transporting ATPase; Copper-translocating P-type ATPase [hydrothermal vent metagenome]|uniref:Lead, cadmium, zinc and mercury transporting ATPase Copper-translocating P-type ATPase n=1 Tax=hydrothermal vent metagenome TaxID=652676 RepID=A0A3B0SKS5_9ZZZZ